MATAYWSFFVHYPNREPVLRELLPPQSLGELRDVLEVFDDQHLLVAGDEDSGSVGLTPVDRVAQLCDGASLHVSVPRRRIYVSRQDGAVRNRPVVWYPGAGAEQIEATIVKACGLQVGTPVELLDGEMSVVISATIPNETALTVVPLTPDGSSVGCRAAGGSSVQSNGAVRQQPSERRGSPPESPRRTGGGGGGPSRVATTPSGPRPGQARGGGGAAQRGQHQGPGSTPSGHQPRNRSATPQGGGGGGGGGGAAAAAQPFPGAGSRTVSPARGGSGGYPEGGQTPGAPTPPDPSSLPSGPGASGGTVHSAKDEHCVHILAGHGGPVLSLCTVGDVLFTGSQDCSIMIWDLNNLQYIGTLPGHSGVVKCMAATLARKMLCSGSQDKTIKIWSLETFSATKTLLGHTSEVNALDIFEGSDLLVSGSEDRSIRVWDLSSLCLLANLDQAHLSGVFAIKQLDAGQFATAGRDRTVKVWQSSTWQPRVTLSPPHFDCVSDLAVAPRSGRFFSASRDRSIRRWDAGTLESDLQLTNAHSDWATSLALSPGEGTLFSGSRDSVVKVWDLDLCCKDVLSGHRGGVSALLAIDNHLFSASHDRTVRVWRVDQFDRV